MRRPLLRALQSFLLLPALLLAPFAEAEFVQRDLQVLARTLAFLDPPLSGTVRVGVLYDPASTAASREADSAQVLMTSAGRAGNLSLVPVLVSLSGASSAEVDIFLLTAGNGQRAAGLRPILETRKLPCITPDLEQVRQGYCTIGIQSAPRVEILINSSLADESGTAFASVFRMMVKEIR